MPNAQSVERKWVVIDATDQVLGRLCSQVAKILRELMRRNADLIDSLGILKPYSFVLEDDDKENLGELYLADDDTVIVGGDLMEGLDSDLDSFFDDLLKEDS